MALFLVRMDVSIPYDLDPDVAADTIAREKEYSQDLQRRGVWRNIWRVAGEYSNYSVFEVEDADELHEILWNLPLFRHMSCSVTALAHHPSDISPGVSGTANE
ncbi:muconolactone Delta-isomerase [Corynebacterium glyciniphilum]|uniref:Muconolactone Delta-isomerase n=1 Tax=Corynebacterium glyciniphilum AJ 3170 TaxID=1404245 RepID=X5DVA1_9CORY|nr:muconolactone Delta-isomerase [Corynebacterium glyciniphilum]AHW64582.1 Putative muconolactone delta-isomerase [Corynebacterium glyciniphilum AJ 3170]